MNYRCGTVPDFHRTSLGFTHCNYCCNAPTLPELSSRRRNWPDDLCLHANHHRRAQTKTAHTAPTQMPKKVDSYTGLVRRHRHAWLKSDYVNEQITFLITSQSDHNFELLLSIPRRCNSSKMNLAIISLPRAFTCAQSKKTGAAALSKICVADTAYGVSFTQSS